MNKGYIVISNALYTDNAMWPVLSMLFRHIRPTCIENRFWENDRWYIFGASALFEPLNEGEDTPQYDVVFTQKEDGAYDLVIKRI